MHKSTAESSGTFSTHTATDSDIQFMRAMRALVEPNKGKLLGVGARGPFDDIMNHVIAPDGVTFESDTAGGIAGWWCRPPDAVNNAAIIHLHGGWFNWGAAGAFRNLVGHIAKQSSVAAFIPDYFTRNQAAELIVAYLDGQNASDPSVSPLLGPFAGLPPIRIHVGDDEMLLEDSRRYIERAVAVGIDAKLDVWMGMPHGFLGGIGKFDAAAMALTSIGHFLSERLTSPGT